jgi:hypothetical protein
VIERKKEGFSFIEVGPWVGAPPIDETVLQRVLEKGSACHRKIFLAGIPSGVDYLFGPSPEIREKIRSFRANSSHHLRHKVITMSVHPG